MADLVAAPEERRWRMVYAVGGAAFLGLFVAWIRLHLPGERGFVDFSTTVVALAAAALGFRRARLVPKELRSMWTALTLACVSWGLGNVAWTYYEVFQGVSAPSPGLADIGYLGFIPYMVAALLLKMLGSGVGASRLRSLLDGLMIALAMMVAAWAAVLRPIVSYAFSASEGDLLAQAVWLAYPFGDVILLALALLTVSRAPTASNRFLAYIGAALLLFTVADIGFWYLNSQGTYVTGSWTDPGWVAAFLLIGYAAIRPIPAHAPAPDFRPGIMLAALPVVPFTLAILADIYMQQVDGSIDDVAFWLTLLLLALMVGRQFVGLRENQKLRRRVEAARDELEVKVQERTRELQKAKEAAEQASATKSKFLAAMSHELRTPLHAIIGLTSTLSDPEGAAHVKPQEVAASIRIGGEQLLSVLNDVLDYTLLEAGHLVVERAPLVPGRQLHETVDLLRGLAEAKGLRIEARVEGDVPPAVLADGPHIRQVLAKLLDNAVKFTAQGSVTATLACRPAGPDWELHYTVEDTGPGIRAEAKERLFAAFSQGDDTWTRKHGGTGLGLAICHRVMQGMGGRVWFESEPGQPTRFHVTLVVPATAAPAPAPALPDRPVDLAALRVLLAEDNAINQKVALSMLKAIGCPADVANDGLEAVAAARKVRYDVILMDLHMPNMDGLEATRTIRAETLHGGWRPQIVAVTADVLPEDRQRCLAVGMDDHVPKPVRLPDLKAALTRVALALPPKPADGAPPAAPQP